MQEQNRGAAINSLDHALEDVAASLGPGQWLPSDTQLAAAFEVSVRTVRRAMARLRDRGIVRRIRGKGTHTPHARPIETPARAMQPRLSAAQRLYGFLCESIKTGELRQGDFLPQVKFFRLQHGVSDNTAREAYAMLEEARLVTRIGRRYSIGAFSPKHNRRFPRTVLVFVNRSSDLPLLYTSFERSAAYRKLERELRANGVSIVYCGRDALDSLQRRLRTSRQSVDGMIFINLDGHEIGAVSDAIYRFVKDPDYRRLLPALADLNSYAQPGRIPCKLHMVSQGNLHTEQARATAGMLRHYPCAHAVLLFQDTQIAPNPLQSYLRYYKMAFESILVQKSRSRFSLAMLRCDPGLGSREVFDRMRRHHAPYLQYLDDKYAARAGVTVRQLHEEMIMAPGFDTITAQTGTNALWLCTTDALTDAALRYCDAAKLAVPRDIGILSLENSPAYYHLSASACAPDWDLIGYLMAHAIIGDFPLNKTSHGYLRIPCPVIQRDTTYPRR